MSVLVCFADVRREVHNVAELDEVLDNLAAGDVSYVISDIPALPITYEFEGIATIGGAPPTYQNVIAAYNGVIWADTVAAGADFGKEVLKAIVHGGQARCLAKRVTL